MASFMSSSFTTGERKKKVVTYGKLSRLPPSRPNLFDDNAPSPERPHKHASTSNRPRTGNGEQLDSVHTSGSARAAAAGPDVFDVPSEDEHVFQPTTPAKRPIVQRRKMAEEPIANATKKAAGQPSRPAATTARSPQKPGLAKPTETMARSSRESAKPRKPAREKERQSNVTGAGMTSQPKTLRAMEGQKQSTANGQGPQGSNTSKYTSRATTPGLSIRPVSKPQLAKTAKPTAQPPALLDEFDVPSEDEDASVPIPKALRQVPRQDLKGSVKQFGGPKALSQDAPRKASAKSNNIGSLQNRKRKGSVSLAAAPRPIVEDLQNKSKERKQQRDRKVAKREEGASPGRESARAPVHRPALPTTVTESIVNKPKRTRTRTVPVTNHPTISKGQSSPAVLGKMLPLEQAPRISSEDAATEVPASDDTMYDIQDAMTTPLRSTPLRKTLISTPGSVTPRQKDLFSTLLGGPAAPKTPASALASLQLTEKKPRSLIGALARSKSDIPHSDQSRKPRLMSALKDKDTSSEGEDSDSDDEANSFVAVDVEMDSGKTPIQAKRTIAIDEDEPEHHLSATADSQTSQITSGATTRPKFTYASQRSYLQEENPEDDLLMSMDLDDNWKLDSQTISTDEEDGPTSQPRTHHELKKYGQNTMFSWDMDESIREISDVSNKSMRRNAMMELCTKMADVGFVGQLLDSGFMHKLLESMTSSGDVIFDFVSAVSIVLILHTKPAFAVINQIHRSGVMTALISLIGKDSDISRIARDRKSNMSKIAKESLAEFRALVLASPIWSSSTPGKLSPQLLALKTTDLLVRSLRECGSPEMLLTTDAVSVTVEVCSILSTRVEATDSSAHDLLALDLAISALEAASITNQDCTTWPNTVLQRLSNAVPVFFTNNALTKTVEAMKLCMNLTNNKPKSCQPFSTQTFIGSLVSFIVARFERLEAGKLDLEGRATILADLTLSLGTMINLAELSDQARLNAINDPSSIEVLVKIFVTGSERAAEASSVEESEVSVVIGFLAVLLGMLCLNTTVRSQIQGLFPDREIHHLLNNMKEFARIHEHVDKKTASRFEGPEGQEALNNYYLRIMHVVRKLESAR
ncbi:hypothetical protein C7974DRAFT_221440 [Boeremia exigua]|uniref:uncharacterized protein n=1 Tax=Boeremia exigua TaxID=749465 RepID=UPI001E8CC4FB|nr:uncharacterized protein C7974DRAFT_221440 [Boeremia exigua]KAH6622387.1 hypothetical protein C7974DRAFT_221440 [Boeremia exigua]